MLHISIHMGYHRKDRHIIPCKLVDKRNNQEWYGLHVLVLYVRNEWASSQGKAWV